MGGAVSAALPDTMIVIYAVEGNPADQQRGQFYSARSIGVENADDAGEVAYNKPECKRRALNDIIFERSSLALQACELPTRTGSQELRSSAVVLEPREIRALGSSLTKKSSALPTLSRVTDVSFRYRSHRTASISVRRFACNLIDPIIAAVCPAMFAVVTTPFVAAAAAGSSGRNTSAGRSGRGSSSSRSAGRRCGRAVAARPYVAFWARNPPSSPRTVR